MAKVLVVDDEPSILQAFEKAFENLSDRYQLTCVSTGEEAIALLQSSDFDLVFIDLRLPKIQGMEVLREARRLRPSADCVIITGYSTVESAVEALKIGASDYVVKPFDVPELMEIVRRVEAAREKRRTALEEEQGFLRWSLALRIQHFVLMVSFFVLAFTGIPLIFPETFKGVFFFEDSSMLRGLVHRAAAVVLMALSAFHVVYVMATDDGHQNFKAIMPRIPADIREAWGRFLYNLGVKKKPPMAGRYNFIEKFEYFGVVWGTFVMVISGLILWFAEEVLFVAPLWVVETAKVVHRYEAILAVLVVTIWHMYTVHLRPGVFPGSKVFWTGRISRREMIEEHPREYELLTGRSVAELEREATG